MELPAFTGEAKQARTGIVEVKCAGGIGLLSGRIIQAAILTAEMQRVFAFDPGERVGGDVGGASTY